MPHAEVTLPGATSSVPTARRFVESLLSAWGQPEVGWSAALCVSELAGNCALHARTRFTVGVWFEDGSVRLEVSDGSSRVPAQRSHGAESTTGRGLSLVEKYSSSWGVDLTPDGKTVWVVLEAERSDAVGRPDEAARLDLQGQVGVAGEDRNPPRVLAGGAALWPLAA